MAESLWRGAALVRSLGQIGLVLGAGLAVVQLYVNPARRCSTLR